MASSAIHRCQHCGCETDVLNVMAMFESNPYCRQVSALPPPGPWSSDLWCYAVRTFCQRERCQDARRPLEPPYHKHELGRHQSSTSTSFRTTPHPSSRRTTHTYNVYHPTLSSLWSSGSSFRY